MLRRLGHEVDFPEGQTCCGQMHFNTGYRAECVPLVRRFADVFAGYDAVVTPSPSCAVMVRHHHAPLAESAHDPALADAVAAVVPRVYELTEFLVDVLGVTDVGAVFPRRGDLPPDLPLGPRPGHRRPAAPAARGRRGADARRPPGRRPVLRVRRDVRGEERGHVAGHGQRQGGGRRGDRRRRAHRGRHVVPDAPRRHAVARPLPDPGHASRGDPRVGGAGDDRTRPRSSADARHADLRRHARRSRRPPAPRSPTTSSGRTWRRRRGRSAPSGPARSPSVPTGRPCGWPARRSRTRSSPTCPSCSSSSRRT